MCIERDLRLNLNARVRKIRFLQQRWEMRDNDGGQRLGSQRERRKQEANQTFIFPQIGGQPIVNTNWDKRKLCHTSMDIEED